VLLETRRELARLRGPLGEAKLGQRQAESAVLGARNSIRDLRSRCQNERERELGTVIADLRETEESLAQFCDRVKRLDVRAPVAGTIHLLTVAGAGWMVAPGASILEIVPSDKALVAHVRVDARDVRYLAPGQVADVSVSGFDVSRYGKIPGRLEWISATSNADEQGGFSTKPVWRWSVRSCPTHWIIAASYRACPFRPASIRGPSLC